MYGIAFTHCLLLSGRYAGVNTRNAFFRMLLFIVQVYSCLYVQVWKRNIEVVRSQRQGYGFVLWMSGCSITFFLFSFMLYQSDIKVRVD